MEAGVATILVAVLLGLMYTSVGGDLCATPHENRVDCGWAGIAPGECTGLGCCYDDSVWDTIWCFPKMDEDECATANGGCAHLCTNTDGSFFCSCFAGYSLNGDGFSCDDVNECASANGGCAQTCTNNVGSFQCSCGVGYSLNTNGYSCDDVNECGSANGGCAQTCTNTIGSFQCSCGAGYTLHGGGLLCNDVNECSSANGGCAETCTNSPGSFQCSCGVGYSLNTNGYSCNGKYVYVNECASANGGCAQTCTNNVGSFVCSCGVGYTLNAGGLLCDDVDECAVGNGGCTQACSNTVGSFECGCGGGYTVDTGGLCHDVNECASANGGCAQTCTNNVGSFVCSCGVGYTLHAGGLLCDDVDECASANGGCAQACTNTIGSYNCGCGPGYTLNGQTCDDVDECATANGGCEQTCTNNIGSFVCSCSAGYNLNIDGFTCGAAACPVLSAPTNGAVTGTNFYQDVATFTCDTGYDLVGSSSLTCQADTTWSGASPTCTGMTCPLLTAPANGAVIGTNFYQDVATFTCDTGYDLVGSSTITCQADATWSGAAPTCTRKECPLLTAPTNGAVTGSNFYQDVATFTCDSGYDLVGGSTITCQADATWSGAVPTCTRNQCPLLTAPTNGAVTGSNFYQDVVTFTCDSGYNLVGSSTLTCQADATWSAAAPTCTLNQCPLLTAPTNGAVTGTNFYQDVATFTCDTGYNLVGSSTLTCQADATWSGATPTCTRNECPLLTAPTNGAMTGSNFYQDVATFTCNSGYNLVGNPTITCQADTTWSGTVPTCQRKQCPVLTAPANGAMTGSNLYQDVVQFTCGSGYDLVGNPSITCQADATWSGAVPTCQRKQCPLLTAPANGAMTGSNFYQDVAQFTCDTGYDRVGNAAVTCQADATWSGNVPTCTRKQCPLLTAPANGAVTGSNFYQDVAAFTCDSGYDLVGNPVLTCQADATWDLTVPICTRKQCPVLAAPLNGAKIGSNFYQDVLQFTCGTGYNLVGNPSITCQADATWSGAVPTCQPVECPLLTAPVNGGMTGSNFYQDLVHFTCIPGYELVGSSSLACRADATWSGTVPTCTRVQCPVLPSPMNGVTTGPNFYMDTVHFTCNLGYYLIGDSSSTCRADQSWSNNVPSCSDINECSAANGGCDHVCTNTIGTFHCSCVTGYNLNADGASCDDINECNFGNGGCQQNCINLIGSFHCSCGIGYELNSDGFSCDDINECLSANGGCQQICTNVIGSFQCSCLIGYLLNIDGFTCDDVDECGAGNGGCEQTCTNLIPSFQCSCGVGYNLNVNGFSCDDLNECSNANGGCEQTCTNTVPGFQCSCGIGFNLNGNGLSCDDINECNTANGGCSQVCNNTIGSYDCFCRTGYELNVDGFACDDIDECDTANGGCGQFCTNTVGNFSCYCAPGYSLQVDSFACDGLPPPTNVTFSLDSRESVTVHWSQPGQTVVLGYRAWLTDKETMSVTSSRHLPQSATAATFTSLAPATEYVVSVSCVSAFFEGPLTEVTFVTETDPPVRLFVDGILFDSLALFWTPPVARLIGYELTFGSIEQHRRRRSTVSVTLPANSDNYLIQDLVPATQYVFSLTAVSRFGRSTTITLTGITGTDPPSDLKVHKVSSTWLYVKWTPPVAAVVSYHLEVIEPSSQVEMHFSIAPSLTDFNVTNLIPTTKYTIRIVAVSVYGRSVNIETFGSTDSTTDLKRFVLEELETTTMSPGTVNGYGSGVRHTITTALSLFQRIKRLEYQVAQSLREGTSSENTFSIIREIHDLFRMDTFPVSSTDFLIELEAAIELYSKSSELIRASQGTKISTMEKMNDVVVHTVSRLVQMLPVGNATIFDTSVDLFKMDVIDVNSPDVSPKRQLKNIKDNQSKFQQQLRKAALSLTESIDRVGDALLAILPNGKSYYSAFKADNVIELVSRFTSNNVVLREGEVNISAYVTDCSVNDSTDATMIIMERNLFSWNTSTIGQNVTTPIIIISLGDRHIDNCSMQVDLETPIALELTDQPRRKRSALQEGGFGGTQLTVSGARTGNMTMAQYAFDVAAATVVVVMQLSWWDHAAAYRVFFRYDSLPTEELYDDMNIAKEEDVVLAWHRGTRSLRTWIPNIEQRRGKLYVGIQTAGPGLQTAPSPRDYELRASTVHLDLSNSAIRCNCSFPRLKAVIGASVHFPPNSIDFDKVFGNPNILTENNIVFYAVIGEWALYILLMIILNVNFQRLREMMSRNSAAPKRKLPQLSILPPDRMPAPYLYQITVNTGSMFGSGTSSRVGFQIFGSRCKTAAKTLNSTGESLVRGGSYDFIMPMKNPLGRLEILHIWHDNTGGGDAASWFLRDIIVKDMQTESDFSKAERLSCCWAIVNSMMVASAMWFRDDNDDPTRDIVYNLGFIQFTLQIFILALIAALICNPTPSNKQRTYDIREEELHVHLLGHKAPEKVYPPEATSVQKMKRKNQQRQKFFVLLQNASVLFLFVAVLFFISQQDKDPSAYHASQTLSSRLTEDFDSITTPEDFWSWTEGVMLPVLYPSFWYNGWKMKYLDRQFPLYTEAFRIGPPRLTQIRAAPATSTMTALQHNHWIDKYTKRLDLELSFYYPSRKLFSTLKLTVIWESIGHFSTSTAVGIHRLFQYENVSDYGVMTAHILFIMLFLVRLINDGIAIKNEGIKYFGSIWNLMASLSLLGSAAAICIFGIRHHFASATLDRIVEATGELGIEKFVDFESTFWWDDAFKYVLAAVVFVDTLALLRMVKFNKTIAHFLALPGAMKNDLIGFSVVSAIAFMAFSSSGMIVFGTHLKAFSNAIHTNFALFEMLLGRFVAQEILEANRYVGPVYFTFFMICIFIILVNFLVTIICDAIASGDSIDDDYDQDLVDYIWTSFKEMLGIHSPPTTDITKTDEDKLSELNANLRKIEDSLDDTLDVTKCLWPKIKTGFRVSTSPVTPRHLSATLSSDTCQMIQEESTLLTSPAVSGDQEQAQCLLKAHEDDAARLQELQSESRRRAEAILQRKLAERRRKERGGKEQTIVETAQDLMQQHAADEERLEKRQARSRRMFESKLRQKLAARRVQKKYNVE
ncbi:PREDICTED: uncharacterized protein LOC109467329 [Branchiostoma belcheri]|uniref:Uncharacterized protein LOC109467329 n=1 Tax=Branchiostoma belcheri TaxID=7741 RepID=A0A6P4Y8N6_BRABE|nr:PREDICTED: uncharacterized protein LOC109467329 [Branchiostoma belcheri]